MYDGRVGAMVGFSWHGRGVICYFSGVAEGMES